MRCQLRTKTRWLTALCVVAAIAAWAAPAQATTYSASVVPGFSGLNGPDGIAVDGAGDLFVADRFNNRVIELSQDGTQTTLPFSGLQHPAGLGLYPGGGFVVADLLNNRVLLLSPSGTQTTLPFSGLSGPDGIAVDPFQNVYVADSGNNRIIGLNPTVTTLRHRRPRCRSQG